MSEFGSLLELLGEGGALRLIELYGGTRLWVPLHLPGDHALTQQLGAAITARLIQYFGGSQIQVPMARRWRARIYHRRGMTYREMARRLGCTEAAVYKALRTPLPEQTELPL